MAAQDLSLPGLGCCLRLVNAPEVARALATALPGWPITARPARGSAPAIRLYRCGDGYRQYAPELPTGLDLPTVTAAVCSLIADLAGEALAGDRHRDRAPDRVQEQGLIGLHCGSVEIDGRLAIFPEAHRAGKSTLSVACAAAGYRVFGDDVLGLTPAGEGMALGIAPRLRLPLPEILPPELVDYIHRRAGPEDAHYRYVIPEAEERAAHGESRPLGAIVLLERDAGLTAPEVVRLAPGEGLVQLLTQNFAYDLTHEALMPRLVPLMERLPCLLLRYAEPLAAARELARVLRTPEADETTSMAEAARMTPRRGVECPAHGRWRASPNASAHALGDELFLIHRPSGAIHRLNATGHAVWALLAEEALSVDELADCLAEHFDRPLAAVARDLRILMGGLLEAGLVIPTGASFLAATG
ncbi:PqqD family protein [Halomonas salifodinae]|uniref:PqqD family protein n=1 Tax=Halomonas salifodinae TaxID=438745 RepID=UPI0033B420A1